MPVCVTEIERVSETIVSRYQSAEVATVHESQGRKGLLASYMKPIYRPGKIAGTAVTCEVAPGETGCCMWLLSSAYLVTCW